MSSRPDETDMEVPWMDVFRLLGMLLLVRREDGRMELQGRAPHWMKPVFGTENPEELCHRDHFLENFLSDAERCWGGAEGGFLSSGYWTRCIRGEPFLFEAVALRAGRKACLVIRKLDSLFHDQLGVLQRARESMLLQEQLSRELELKEIIQHCIVHDLNAPLLNIRTALSAMERETDGGEVGRLREVALRQSLKASALASQILSLFKKQSVKEPVEGEALTDVAEVVDEAVRMMFPSAQMAEVSLACPPLDAVGGVRVHMAPGDLERVLVNLLSNAIRHTARGSSVVLEIRRIEERIRFEVHDRGPGVPGEMRERIFDPLVQGEERRGSAGLGLYYCRIMVRKHFGSIGVHASDSGGACFWFELPCR